MYVFGVILNQKISINSARCYQIHVDDPDGKDSGCERFFR